jgi:hypothetical protein
LVNVSNTLKRLGLQADLKTGDAGDPGTFWDGPRRPNTPRRPLFGDRGHPPHPDIKVLRRRRTSRAWRMSSPASRGSVVPVRPRG